MAATASGARHTILLIQVTEKPSSRTYHEYNSQGQAWDAVVKMYEARLQELNPALGKITYDVTHLFAYIDSLGDLCGLVFNPTAGMYEPLGKKAIQEAVFAHLKRQAGAR